MSQKAKSRSASQGLKPLEPGRVALISLGCPKNLIDSEVILGRLATDGFLVCRDALDADAVVINTCGFLDAAREESKAVIQEALDLKAKGRLGAVIVAGCLVDRVGRSSLESELPGVDAYLPITDYSTVHEAVRQVLRGGDPAMADRYRGGAPVRGPETDFDRLLLTPPSYSYLRIAEGCSNKCTFCAIPAIRGKIVQSKPIEILTEEARQLAASGVRELIIVGEDTTAYGRDLYGVTSLDRLLSALAEVQDVSWIRLLYTYPSFYNDALIHELATNPKVIPYVDMPIQHANDRVLKAMRRGNRQAELRELIGKLRERVPGIALRTTLIVGFPGETEAEFEDLMQFLEWARFDRLGAFAFSPEPGTPAFDLPDRVSDEVANERQERVMDLQRRIIEEDNEQRIGDIMAVMVDGLSYEPEGFIEARSYRDCPEIDCRVLLRDGQVSAGDVVEVEIEESLGFDLIGSLVEPEAQSER
ncbi:MAG: 30S ribosomal protein S12 methylthiotransferase RimO [Planctomycetota bacterium]